tara:strand:- start:1036 stop:1209 length:174 start_codon:yes stop_codon:yes gene_type:complete
VKVGDLVKLSDHYIKTFGITFGIIVDLEGLFIMVSWVSDTTIKSYVHINDIEIITTR